MTRIALLVLAALSAGCSITTAPDFQVRIDSAFLVDGKYPAKSFGHGILIDERTVLTVRHVAPDASRTYVVSRASWQGPHLKRIRFRRAHYAGQFAAGFSIEPLSVLRLSKPMHCEAYPELRGIEAGDSGSPILGKRGAVVGLITGHSPMFGGRTILGTNGPSGPVPRDFKPQKAIREED